MYTCMRIQCRDSNAGVFTLRVVKQLCMRHDETRDRCSPHSWVHFQDWRLTSSLRFRVLEAEDVFPGRGDFPSSNTTYFAPSVIYNKLTGMYVLWMLADVVPGSAHHNEPGAPKKHNAVSATSARPAGPFSRHPAQWALAASTPATTNVFPYVSADGRSAYMQTNLRRAPFGVYVVELDRTFTTMQPARRSSVVGGNFANATSLVFLEGGGVFSHNGAWWLMAGRNGCMDIRGADVRVWRASSPLGPYSCVASLGCSPFPLFRVPA